MLNNFFLLKEIAAFLEKEISGYTIYEIYTQEKDKLVFILQKQGTGNLKYLEFSCDDKLPYLLLKKDFSKARKNVVNLLESVNGLEFRKVNIFDNDRIIKVHLSDNFFLYFIFFKSKCNLLVLKDEKVIDSFKNKKELTGIYLNNFLEKKETFSKKNIKSVKDYFRSTYRQYGDTIFNEILFLCGITANENINNEIKLKIDDILNSLNEKYTNPKYLIYTNNSEYIPSLIELTYLNDFEKLEYENINELVQNYIKFYYRKTSSRELQKNVLTQKENELKNSERKYNSFLKQLDSAGNSEQFKNYGDLILSNIHLINKGDESLLIEDGKIKINLKKELPPSENAALYYDKYKRQKSSVNILKEKLDKQQQEIDLLKKEIEDIKNNKDIKSFKKMEKELNKEDETSRFRKFILDEKFEVWVGKDSASNDSLTTRHSAQNDLWFHVRGASGSHTVLKISDKKNPPEKKIIEKAASIAAYYSKARNASNVPVAYCERKYVKKKKGFKEGSVIMEREKVIFVKPGLPENLS